MNIFATFFWLPKAGNSEAEYEDAFYPTTSGAKYGNQLRWAIADGASEGMLSGRWAEILVKIFCRSKECDNKINDLLTKAYEAWNGWKNNYLRERERLEKPIQWYELPGLTEGAFSSFLYLTFLYDEGIPKWSSGAIGDSCLFQIRNQQLIFHFPIEYSADFNSRPLLVCSNPNLNRDLENKIRHANGSFQKDDSFYLMTDALAFWFLSECEQGEQPWEILRDLDTRDQNQTFEDWVYHLRSNKRMRNDDVTLIRLDVL